MTMIRAILNLIIITLLVGCGTKSNSTSDKDNSHSRTDTSKIENAVIINGGASFGYAHTFILKKKYYLFANLNLEDFLMNL